MASTAPLNHTLPFPPRLHHPKTSPSSLFLISISTSSSSPSSEEYLPALSTTLTSAPASRRRVTTCSASAPDQPGNLSFSPPTTKDEAIAQARTCLANALARPLNNAALPRLAGKLKKQRQPRLRLEIPVFDDSPDSLSRLALDVVSDLPTKRNPPPKLLLLWPTPQLTSLAAAGVADSNSVINSKFESLRDLRPGLAAADVVVFFSPASSRLGSMREICEAFHPKPAVLFNPGWGYEEEGEMAGNFVRSFEVVYSFMGLEVRGVLSRKRGVVFRCTNDGGLGGGDGWEVMVEGEGGKMEMVTRFKRRPAMGEVENVLYNVMAMNSPVTKTVKFLRNLAPSSSSSSKDKEDEKKKKKKMN